MASRMTAIPRVCHGLEEKIVKENKFQRQIIEDLEELFPTCEIYLSDANHRQGRPDIVILYNNKWAALECKREKNAKHQPNQDYYIDKMNKMSYAAFIYPENVEEILYEIQHALSPRRKTRLPKRFKI